MTGPDPQSPAADEGDVRLTEAEREALAEACWLLDGGDPDWGWTNLTDHNRDHHRQQVAVLEPAVERIVAERVRVVEGERDVLVAAYATAPSCEAQGTCRALNESVRVLPCNAAATADRVRRETAEEIAAAIEANWSGEPLFDLGVEDSARIAREAGTR